MSLDRPMTPEEAVALAKEKAKLRATLSAELTGHVVTALTTAEEAIARVRALHERGTSLSLPATDGFCWADGRTWPCPTIQALDAR